MNVLLNTPAKVDAFSAIFQSIRNLTQSVNIQFNDERMYVQTMDSGRISILEVSLPCSWFGEYTCAQPVSLGVNVAIFHKILSTAKKDHSIRIHYHAEDQSDTLTVEMKSTQAAHGSFDQQFSCPLVDLEEEVLSPRHPRTHVGHHQNGRFRRIFHRRRRRIAVVVRPDPNDVCELL